MTTHFNVNRLQSNMSPKVSILVIISVVGLGIGIGYNLCIPKTTKVQTCSRDVDIEKSFEPHNLRIHLENAFTEITDFNYLNQPKTKLNKPPNKQIRESVPPESEVEGKSSDDHCFCQLEGAIEDCTCQVDTVDSFNNFKVYPRMQSLLTKDYFRYFQVNLGTECPFWADDSQCALESCQVRECRDDEVPSGLKGQRNIRTNKLVKLEVAKSLAEETCGENDSLGYINTTISEESQEGFERWKIYDDSLSDFCTLRDDEIDEELQYVDLLLNPERFTGYRGPSAHRIWKSIYLENCFKLRSEVSLMAPFETENVDEFCIEKRTFYRVISGLHASINIHLSAKYLITDGMTFAFLSKAQLEKQWGPNLTEFRQHFDGSLNKGQSSAWLKNLYFLYLLELKAIWKLSPYLQTFNFYTGNPEEDSDVSMAVKDVLGVIDKFPSHFEESALFSRNDAAKLKAEFHTRFTNITRIMDCVGCQKCKLWGKLQIKGLGTALKILFSEPFHQKRIGNITRNEIVALLNSFGRLSESIYELDNFRRLIAAEKAQTQNKGKPQNQSNRKSNNLFY